MSSTCEPEIWPRDTGQRIPFFNSCQLVITCMSKLYVGIIREHSSAPHLPRPIFLLPPPVGLPLIGLHSPSRRVCTGGRAGGRTHQIFLASWVYQKFLPMVLRWRASRAGAPLLSLPLLQNKISQSSFFKSRYIVVKPYVN